MPLRSTLRALVTARLTEAAEDIFELFERTIAEYEEELCQRSFRGLEERVKAVEQELSRALLSQNTTVSLSPPRRFLPSVAVDERTTVSATVNSAAVETRTPTAAPVEVRMPVVTPVEVRLPIPAAVEEQAAVSSVGTSATVEERAAVSVIKAGGDVIQSAWHQVFTTVDELLSCASTFCIFCAKQKLGNEAHLLHKHLKEALYFVSNNTERFVIACFCQEKPLEHKRSHYHCPFCDFRAFSRDSTFRKHLTGVHGIIGNKKSGAYPALLCPALAQNQEIAESPQTRDEEQCKVKLEEEQLPVPVAESSAACVKTEVSSRLRRRQTSTYSHSDSEDTDNDDDWTHPLDSSASKRTRPLPRTRTAPGTSSSAAERRKHQCPFCLKRFGFKQVLLRHVRVHVGSDNASEQRRRNNPSGERPYSCSACGKGFSSNSRLIVHVRSHRGQRPFSCSVCEKTFASRTQQKTHMETHSRNNS